MEVFQDESSKQLKVLANETSNLDGRVRDTEGFMKQSGSSIDKQAREIFDELMTPVVAKLKIESSDEITNLEETIKQL